MRQVSGFWNHNRCSITLSELQGKPTMLEIACHRCERHGRVSVARLIEAGLGKD
jgi:hypothetical protein